MQGMLFVILNEKGEAVNHGIIAQAITPEKYLCQFRIPSPVSRIIPIEELQGYSLFNNEQQMNQFLAAVQKQVGDKKPAPAPKKKNKVSRKSK